MHRANADGSNGKKKSWKRCIIIASHKTAVFVLLSIIIIDSSAARIHSLTCSLALSRSASSPKWANVIFILMVIVMVV